MSEPIIQSEHVPEPQVSTHAETTETESGAGHMDIEDETVMSLPLSKIKKIFKMDPEYAGSSASAVYATGAATELFVQYLVEQASMNAKAEKRKKIQYRDLSSAVSASESLYFLGDTIPRTQTVEKAIKGNKIDLSQEDKQKFRELSGDNAPETEDDSANAVEEVKPVEKAPVLSKGQSTLPFASVPAPKTTKKAALSALMVADENAQNGDAMVID